MSLNLLRNDALVFGAFTVFVYALISASPESFATHEPNAANIVNRLQAPSAQHFLGTDHLGRDVYSRVIHGARYSLVPSVIVILIAMTLGCSIGLLAAQLGGRTDWVLMRLSDLMLGFPLFVMAMAIVAVIGRGLLKALMAGIVVWWAQYARIMRAVTLSVQDLPYVEASEVAGGTRLWIMRKHIVPNVMGTIVVKATYDVGRVLLLLTGLSFLGLGTRPPTPEWGVMITEARQYIFDAWWYSTFPGLAIITAAFGFNMLGDGLTLAMDPRQNLRMRQRRSAPIALRVRKFISGLTSKMGKLNDAY